MHFQIACIWFWFCIALGTALLASIIMSRQGRNFYTRDGSVRSFSIIDLQMAATPLEIVNIIKGIYALPEEESKRTLRALKGQLYIDFIFMPAIYGAVFLLCMQVSGMMTFWGRYIFATLAWLQLLPWLCDIIENIYLLQKIKPKPVVSNSQLHKAYQLLEIIKWGFSLTGGVCAIAALFFFWLSGRYSIASLQYLLIIVAELIIFLIAGKLFAKRTSRVS